MIRLLLQALMSLFRRAEVTPSAPAVRNPGASGARDVTPPPAGVTRLSVTDRVLLQPLLETHGVFDSAARWRLTSLGLEVNGRVEGTPGLPTTALRAFEFFGPEFRAAAAEFGVPIELLVACACAEASVDIRRGRDAARLSERREPGFVSYAATPHRVSVGVMHTLLSTARAALEDPGLSEEDLRTPGVSIRAGAAYIASQRAKTRFDPPLVGAAYNAGGVYDDPVSGLPFSLRDYPAGEDRHVVRFVEFFNDVCRLVNEDPGLARGAPSFMRWLS